MASFPGSVKSFTTKNTGDVVQASHINDLQDEVNAIEDGYVNGTARLNSSNSTVARLNVSGVSTLAGAVTLGAGVASTASFASSVTFSSGVSYSTSVVFATRPIAPPPESALVFRDTTSALGSSARSTVAWNAESYVSNSSIHSTATNPERLTPQTTGLFEFVAQCAQGGPAAASLVFIQILDSSNTQIGSQSAQVSLGSSSAIICRALKRFDLTGSYCVAEFLNSAGGSTFSLSSGIGFSWFSMVKL